MSELLLRIPEKNIAIVEISKFKLCCTLMLLHNRIYHFELNIL